MAQTPLLRFVVEIDVMEFVLMPVIGFLIGISLKQYEAIVVSGNFWPFSCDIVFPMEWRRLCAPFCLRQCPLQSPVDGIRVMAFRIKHNICLLINCCLFRRSKCPPSPVVHDIRSSYRVHYSDSRDINHTSANCL